MTFGNLRSGKLLGLGLQRLLVNFCYLALITAQFLMWSLPIPSLSGSFMKKSLKNLELMGRMTQLKTMLVGWKRLLACVINTISYPIHFKDALAEVFIPLRAHITAQIPLLALQNSKCPVCGLLSCW